MRRLVTTLLLVPFALSVPLPAAAPANPGVVMEIEVKDLTSGGTPEVMTARIEGTNARMQVVSGGQGVPGEVIFRGDRSEMLMIDHGQKSYVVMDEATIERLAGQLGDAMKQMEAALANVPPEQRAMVEQMMRGRGMGAAAAAPRPAPELRRTSERAEHSGFSTVKYEVLVEGRKTREFWVTDWNNIDGFQEAQPAFEAMAAMMKRLLDVLAQSPLGNLADMDTGGYEYMTELGGFPVLTREFGSTGELETETTLRSIRRESIPASEFQPPEGYRQQQIGG